MHLLKYTKNMNDYNIFMINYTLHKIFIFAIWVTSSESTTRRNSSCFNQILCIISTTYSWNPIRVLDNYAYGCISPLIILCEISHKYLCTAFVCKACHKEKQERRTLCKNILCWTQSIGWQTLTIWVNKQDSDDDIPLPQTDTDKIKCQYTRSRWKCFERACLWLLWYQSHHFSRFLHHIKFVHQIEHGFTVTSGTDGCKKSTILWNSWKDIC